MTLHQIGIFLSICKFKNFTRAAQELHLSQSSVSVQLHQLEDTLGCKLIDQIGKRIYLTEAGQIVEQYARKIWSLIQELQEVMGALRGLKKGTIHIGASTTPGTYLLPRILGEFKTQFPQINISLEIANSREIEKRLLSNELDLGFIGGEVAAPEIKKEQYILDELVLISSPKNALTAKRKSLALKDLEGQRFILREKGSATREIIERLLASQNFSMDIALELGSPEAVKQAVEAGLGLSFVSRYSVLQEVAEGRLCIIKLKDMDFQRPLYIIYLKDKQLSPAAQAFLDIARAFAQQLHELAKKD